jgi:hypothetical protein
MLDAQCIAEYLRRSYLAIDGLWFMKTEERLDFDEALLLDVAVWKIMAKIQARKACELLKLDGKTLSDLLAALELKFSAEQYTYAIKDHNSEYAEVEISGCPWMTMMERSGRMHLADRVANAICGVEYEAWAKEFSPTITTVVQERRCNGAALCRITLEQAEQ